MSGDNVTPAGSPDERNTPQSSIWGAARSLKRLQAEGPPLVRAARGGRRPLSFAEERLWFLAQAQPESPAYNVPLVWSVAGPLDVPALEKSLNGVMRHHEILRTSYPTMGGQPVAVVDPAGAASLRVEDLRASSGPPSEQDAFERARLEVRRPFDVRRGPLLRAALFGWAPAEHLLVVTVHQIAIDGSSILLFSRELVERYQALTEGRSAPLREPSVRYADFACWQRGFLKGRVLEDGTSYWSDVLRAAYAPLRFPGEPRNAPNTGPARRLSWSLSREATEGVRRLAQHGHATEFMVFVAALQAVLHVHTRAEDVIVFASWAARSRPELRDVLGLFANVLPLRAGVNGASRFCELLRHVRAATLGAFAHQDLPLARIVEFLRPDGDHRHDSLFQVMVIHHNAPAPVHTLARTAFTPVDDVDNGVARFPLLFDVVDTNDGLTASVKYRSDVLSEATVGRMLSDLRLVLERAAADPELRLEALETPSAPEALPPAPPDRAPLRSGERPEAIPPRDSLEQQLLAIWKVILGPDVSGIRDNFFDLGGDSLAAVQVFVEVEALLGRRLPLATLLEAPTIEKLAALLRAQGYEPTGSSLVFIQGGHGRPPLFCVPGVGGNVLGYVGLARHLGPDQPVYGLQAQGLDGKRDPFTTIEDMATHHVDEILPVQPTGPILLVGQSFGGTVAFEMARQLEAKGRRVSLLALFDTFASLPASPLRWSSVQRRLRAQAGRLLYHGEAVLRGPARIDYVRRKARTLRRRLRSRVWQLMYRAVRSRTGPLPKVFRDVREAGTLARKRYVAGPYGGKVTLFRAEVRSFADLERPDMGWGDYAQGGVNILAVPGDHLTMMDAKHVGPLARRLRTCIDEALAGEPRAGATPTGPIGGR